MDSPYIITIGILPTKGLLQQQLTCDSQWLSFEEAQKTNLIPDKIAVILVGEDLSKVLVAQNIVTLGAVQALVISPREDIVTDIEIPKQWPIAATVKAMNVALKYWQNHTQLQHLQSELTSSLSEKSQLSQIGIALSAEKDLSRLLEMVLSKGRELSDCEAASLFLVDKSDEANPLLSFKLAQNEMIELDFEANTFPLSKKSLAGYVALTGKTLNIPDVYQIDQHAPYSFDHSFDASTGFRTRELLVLPMQNHDGNIIGVLQFLNIKNKKTKLSEQGFGTVITETLTALASQAAVAIDNSLLLENIHQLFEGFVSASVKAIESRDPVTSGHSFRVAELTIGLAESLCRSQSSIYGKRQFSTEEVRELRYAALLHDFGKVGVRERVLLKPKKLDATRLEVLKFRILWLKERLQKDYYLKLCELQKIKDKTHLSQKRAALQATMNNELSRLEHFYQVIVESNEPSILDEDAPEHLHHISCYQVEGAPWEEKGLISEDDFLALSVKRGSLTEDERREIESHVVNTFDYLQQIPWTNELKNIPKIASAHHEKLNGTGYPRGLTEEQIPLQSRIMTIADIYDALTARDRPYKSSLPNNIAMDILSKEAKQGLLDVELVQIFTEAKIYQLVE